MFLELAIIFIILVTTLHIKRRLSLPPGPFSLPIIGSLIPGGLRLLAAEAHFKYDELCTFLVGPSIVIIMINDYQLSKELFSKDEFSGRVKTWWHQNVRGINGRILGIVNTEGQIWSHQRRFALKELRDLGFGKKSLDSVMVQEVDEAIDKLLSHGNGIARIEGTFNTAIINVLWQIVASKRFEPEAPDTKHMMSLLNLQFTTGVSPFNFIDFLKKRIPFNAKDKSFFKMKDMMRALINEHMSDIDYENPRDFIDAYLKEMQHNSNFDLDHLIVICLDFFQAGAETTSTTLLWAVMFMAIHTDVQKKCQEEIDEKLGSRPPTLDDMPKLIYVMATIMEIARVGRIAPSSLPHFLTEDTQVRGYSFKKGTVFMSNLNKFLLDPSAFPEPKKFKPERFLDNEGSHIVRNDHFVPFGIGKRICMGESLAKNELFIFFVRFLQKIKIEQIEKLDPEKAVVGITRLPKPFKVKVSNRFQESLNE